MIIFWLNVTFSTTPVVLIVKRSVRAISNLNDVIELVRNEIRNKTTDLAFYDDKHLPDQTETMLLFHRASLIIAPHGAGLSNILFAKPGTSVIELHCIGAKNVRMSFLNPSIKLGHALLCDFY